MKLISFIFIILALKIVTPDKCPYCPEEKNSNGDNCDVSGKCNDQERDCGVAGLYGPKCDQACVFKLSHCQVCNRKGDKCRRCESGYYGPDCKKECSNCPYVNSSYKCSMSGKCTDRTSDCIDSKFYGPNCDQKCNGKCCSRDGEKCN